MEYKKEVNFIWKRAFLKNFKKNNITHWSSEYTEKKIKYKLGQNRVNSIR